MNGVMRFFKVFSSFRIMGSAINRRKRTKQVALSVLVLLLTFSIVLTLPETTTTTTTSINPSNQVATKTMGITFWNETYGKGQSDVGYWVEQTSDARYILTGDIMNSDQHDIWLMKTYSNGDQWWNQTYGGSLDDVGYCVRQTDDGGYIIVGYTYSYGPGKTDVWLIKTNHAGEHVWNQTYGGSEFERGQFVEQTDDKGFIIAGHTTSSGAGSYDVWLIKTDENGTLEWDKTYGGINEDKGYCVHQTSDGGYIITGHTNYSVFGTGDVWLIKTDSNGNNLWNQTFGGIWSDFAETVEQTTDGGYIIVGGTNSSGAGNYDVWLIKTDANGNKLWDKTYGGTNEDVGRCIEQTMEGGYIITGGTNSYGVDGSQDVWLIKTDENGNILWDKTYGGTGYDYGNCVLQNSNRGYIIAGTTNSFGVGGDIWLINPDGDPIINHPDNITYVVGSTGNTIVWHPSDENPSSFKVTREGIQVNSSSWNDDPITVNVDGLSVGNYTYKCTVYDTSGQNASDTVIVRVIEQISEFIWNMIFTIIAVIGIATVIKVVSAKHKR